MKLKDYIKKLQEVEAKHGGELKVIYSSDQEGNSYDEVFYSPTTGHYNKSERDWTDKGKINSVCVN